MVNTTFFAAQPKDFKEADAVNKSGAKAYTLSAETSLAQIVVSGVFNDSFYTKAEEYHDTVVKLLEQVSTEFIAKLAIYGRKNAFMKDMPAYLVAHLAAKDINQFKKVFPLVINDGKMLRNFIQILRSGATGRRGLGTAVKKAVANWIQTADEWKLLNASIGNNPSLKDIISLARPKPDSAQKSDFYQWISNRDYNEINLPDNLQELMKFRRGQVAELPKVPFMMLLNENMNTKNWCDLALNCTWTQLRSNLNVFIRNGVMDVPGMQEKLAARLSDALAVEKAKVFPYQIFAAYINADLGKYPQIKDALKQALAVAIKSVPVFEKKIVLLTDVSGSMSSPVTGHQGKKASSKVRCVDAAALLTSVLLANNPGSYSVLFETRPRAVIKAEAFEGVDVFTVAEDIARIGGGGTDCASALEYLNRENATEEVVVFISDNESWVNVNTNQHLGSRYYSSKSTNLMNQWNLYKKRVPTAKMICIDITPSGTYQVPENSDIFHISGFSDDVFRVINEYASNMKHTLVEEINKVAL